MTPSKESITSLFTYGSLMCQDIMAAVSTQEGTHQRATLHGFRRFLVKNEQYPGIIPVDDGVVHGIIYHDINREGWIRLDRFEGEMYDRKVVSVQLADGTSLLAYCYAIKPKFRDCLTTIEWDFEEFLRTGKTLFQHRYGGFQEITP